MQPCYGRFMKLGALALTPVDDGGFRLDGGAMFGVVPKVLWDRKKPADAQNRIAMMTNSLLVERGDDLLLIETGIGDKNDAKFRAMFGMQEGARRLPRAIEDAGFDLGDITHVLLTHLHFDHCGWNTREDRAGRVVPTFPNARYWLQRDEVDHARDPNPRDAASYDPRNWEPLFEAGQVEIFEDAGSPIEGVVAHRAPGHNDSMCVLTLDGGAPGARAIWLADLVPTAAHLPYPWVMGFDLYPLETMASKARWLPRAAAEGWACFFGHDADMPVARLEENRPGRFAAVPLDGGA